MSARALVAPSLEPAADYKATKGAAAEIQFREALWREYWLEAVNAGFSPAQATAYASALITEMSLTVGASGMAPVGRDWFYQSRGRVVRRTYSSAPIGRTRRGKSEAAGRTAAGGAALLAPGFRWWDAGEES